MATIGTFTDRDLGATISDKAQHVGDKVRDRIDGAGARLGDLTTRVQDRVMDAKDRVSTMASDLQKNSRQVVKQNPIAAVAIGVGIGFLLGRILFR